MNNSPQGHRPQQRPLSDVERERRRPRHPPGGAQRRSWLDSAAPDGWWSAPSRPGGSQVVDQDAHPQDGQPVSSQQPRSGRGHQGNQGHKRQQEPPRSKGAAANSGHAATQGLNSHPHGPQRAHLLVAFQRVGGAYLRGGVAFFFTHVLPVGGFFVVFLLLGVLFVYILHFGQIGMRLPHAQTPTRQVTPTMITLSPTVAPSPTPTPAQTELDGVITIENLDASATFVGIVSVRSGRYTCRNAPLPNSSWNIVLTGGATTQVPCVIPVSSPTSLPIHTFTTVETGQNGQGRVLIDNLTPFTGTTSRDTP